MALVASTGSGTAKAVSSRDRADLTGQISLVKTGWMVMISRSVRKIDLSTMVNPQVNSVQ
jgi:hypothetical protein